MGHSTVNKPEVESKKTPCPVALFRDCIFKLLRSPEIYSKELIPPAYVAWRAGATAHLAIPTRFLAPIVCSKIPAQFSLPHNLRIDQVL